MNDNIDYIAQENNMKLKYINREALSRFHHKKRSEQSDFILLYYFKSIRYQCKYMDRPIDTLLEYINELEYRNIKYRL